MYVTGLFFCGIVEIEFQNQIGGKDEKDIFNGYGF